MPSGLIIIGGGSAGLPAAIKAAEAGAPVTVIEKNEFVGGTMRVAGGQISAGGTAVQAGKGIVDSADEHGREVIEFGNGQSDPELVRLATGQAPRMIEWFSAIGVTWDPNAPRVFNVHTPYRTPRTYWPENGNGWKLYLAVEPVFDSLVAAGRIHLLDRSRATDLTRIDGGWRVTYEGPGGKAAVEGAVVVLATGGYAANRSVWNDLHPGREQVLARCQPFAEGEGLILGTGVGARISHAETLMPSIGLIEDPDQPGTAYPNSASLNPWVRKPREIWVNGHGRRFTREDELVHRKRQVPVLDQPDQRFWVIFDETILNEGPPLLLRDGEPEQVRAEAARGRFLWSAETISELAIKSGLPADSLAETVAHYNQAVASGRDDDLGREYLPFPIASPPFYALKCAAGNTFAYAGLAVGPKLELLDGDGQPIPGLYAAGEILGGGRFMGQSSISGMALGPAIALGLYLGEKLGRQLATR